VVSSANLRAIQVWPAQILSAGHYRVVIDAQPPAQYHDISGQSVAAGAPGETGETVISTFNVEAHP
jgi:hypothetical protein